MTRRAERRLDDRQVDVEKTSSPSRTKRGSRADAHQHVHVAGVAPVRARVAFPGERIRWPSWMPGGTSTSSSCSSSTRPAPLAASRTGARPRGPRRRSAGTSALRTNSPKTLRDTCWTLPVAGAVGARRRARARLGAVAPQRSHTAATWTGDRPRHAGAASSSSISTAAADVAAPRRGRRGCAPKRSSPKNAEKMSARLPKSKSLGREAAAPEARVAEPVVELARLGLREHLVRLGDLPEPLLGVGRVRDVRMELAREPPEGPLDLGLGRRPLDAEDLVVVASVVAIGQD